MEFGNGRVFSKIMVTTANLSKCKFQKLIILSVGEGRASLTISDSLYKGVRGWEIKPEETKVKS